MLQELLTACFKMISQNFPGWIEKTLQDQEGHPTSVTREWITGCAECKAGVIGSEPRAGCCGNICQMSYTAPLPRLQRQNETKLQRTYHLVTLPVNTGLMFFVYRLATGFERTAAVSYRRHVLCHVMLMAAVSGWIAPRVAIGTESGKELRHSSWLFGQVFLSEERR
jgi:hypothetical protein